MAYVSESIPENSCFPDKFRRMSVNIAIYAYDVVLWAISKTDQGSPARADLQHGVNWTVHYLGSNASMCKHLRQLCLRILREVALFLLDPWKAFKHSWKAQQAC